MVVFNVRVSSWDALYEVVGWDGLVLLFLHLRDAIGDTCRLLLDRVKRSKFRVRLILALISGITTGLVE